MRISSYCYGCFYILVGYAAICGLLNQAFKNDQSNFGPITTVRTVETGREVVVAIATDELPQLEREIEVIKPQPPAAVKAAPKPEISDDHVKATYAKMIIADRPRLSLKTAEGWAQVMREEEKKHNLPTGLVLSISHTESWHDPNAVSCVGALGLMQIMPPTAKDFGPKVGVWKAPEPPKLSKKASWSAKNKAQKAFEAEQKKAEKQLAAKLHEPTSNIKVGAKVLSEYLKSEGNLPKALKKYSGDATYSKRVGKYRAIVLAKLKSEASNVE